MEFADQILRCKIYTYTFKTLKIADTMYVERMKVKTLFAKLESNQGSSALQLDVLTATPRIVYIFIPLRSHKKES